MIAILPPTSSPEITFHAGDVSTPTGFWTHGAAAHLRDASLDVMLLVSSRSAVFSGLFTTNAVRAAPVALTELVHRRGISTACIVNSKNANALTGQPGLADARAMQALTAEALEVPPETVAVASTGVIGMRLPMDKVSDGIRELTWRYQEGQPADGMAGARAILTTDTEVKRLAATVTLSTGQVKIGMIAKGSGMIHPNLATMLAFFATDAVVNKPVLDRLLKRAVDRSFHRVSVDGDQSTNDMVLIWANGTAGVSASAPDDLRIFETALTEIARHGARLIAADGEGATHLISVVVRGARSEADAALKARAVAGSSLVKAAVYGRDPNWGRVLAAAGAVGDAFDPDQASLSLNGWDLYVRGQPVQEDESRWSQAMEQAEVEWVLDLASGAESAEAWGCDLTEGYVHINAHYRT